MKRRREDDDTRPVHTTFYDREKMISEVVLTSIEYNRHFHIPTSDYTFILLAQSLLTGEEVALLNRVLERCIQDNTYKTSEEIKQSIKDNCFITQNGERM